MKKFKKGIFMAVLSFFVVNVNNIFAADESMVILNSTSSTCNIYAKPDKKEAITYISPNYGRDAALIQKSGDWYKIAIGGVVGWMPKSTCIGTGDSMVKKISTVSRTTRVSNGVALSGLNVSRYQVVGNKMYFSVSYGAGYAPIQIGYTDVPSGLKNNTVYYSNDGIYYYTNYNTMVSDIRANRTTNAANKTPYYNYYQYVPLRTTSKISGNVFDSILLRQRTDANVPYKETKTLYQSCNKTKKFTSTYNYYKSAVYKKGNAFASRQNTYKVNAGALYGIMLNESAYGTSQLSYHYNNLFGWGAVDSCPASAKRFGNIEDSISEYYKWISGSYANPIDYRGGMGTHLGNKKSGANVKYASDPYWGYKNAYNYRLLDASANNVDKYTYKIGVVNSGYNAVDSKLSNEYVYAYSSPSTTASKPFYYERNGASVVIQGESGSFYKIQNDSKPNGGSVYILKSKVKVASNSKGASTSTNNNTTTTAPATTKVNYSKSGNTHYIWGLNNEGQLGNGNRTNTNTKVNLNSVIPQGEVISNVIVYGNKNVFILTKAGNVYASGNNSYGQRSYKSVANRFNKVNPFNVKIRGINVRDYRLRMQKSANVNEYYYLGKNGFNYISDKWNRNTAYPVLVGYNKAGVVTHATAYNYSLSTVSGKYYYAKNKLSKKYTYTYDSSKNVKQMSYYTYNSYVQPTYGYILNKTNNKNTTKYEYYYVNGKLKSTNNKKAYRYQTLYNSNQKAYRTYKVYYNNSGKLSKNYLVQTRK